MSFVVPSFADLGLSDTLLRTLEALGHHTPTPVQVQAIAAILRGDDVRASAKTGSGKTAAFLLPILKRLEQTPKDHSLSVLILSPTRELAAQIAAAAAQYSKHCVPKARVCLVVGGESGSVQAEGLSQGANIVVATPGRLFDLIQHEAISLERIHTLVLDEADRLLSLGFAEKLQTLLVMLPEPRQTLLFSATMPKKVLALADATLREPTIINVDNGGLADIQQRAIEVDENMRTRLLVHLLKNEPIAQAIVFVASRAGCEDLVVQLSKKGVLSAALHGDMRQSERTQALDDFKRGRIKLLIATDLAARGLDVEQLPAVVNYDLPRSPTEYVHRVGRTGRAGESGLAISFVTVHNHPHFRLIEKRHGLTIARERMAGFEPKQIAEPPRDPNGGVKGKRKSKKDRLREAAAKAAEQGKK